MSGGINPWVPEFGDRPKLAVRFTPQSLHLKGKFYVVRIRGWMDLRASLDALYVLAGKQTAIRRLFIPHCNLKIVRIVLSGLQLKKERKKERKLIGFRSKHT
jgi:hypothetical protein